MKGKAPIPGTKLRHCSHVADPSQKATAIILSEQGWTDTPPHPWWPFPSPLTFLEDCSLLLPTSSGSVDSRGRGRSVEEPVAALLTRSRVQNIPNRAAALPRALGEDLCPQSASSRHKRMHSCSEKLAGQEIVRLPCKQTKCPEDNVCPLLVSG